MNTDTEGFVRAAGLGRIALERRERTFRGQEFDQYFFAKKFDTMEVVEEATTYLEILNYTVSSHSLCSNLSAIERMCMLIRSLGWTQSG